jgi:hypothetical protein
MLQAPEPQTDQSLGQNHLPHTQRLGHYMVLASTSNSGPGRITQVSTDCFLLAGKKFGRHQNPNVPLLFTLAEVV